MKRRIQALLDAATDAIDRKQWLSQIDNKGTTEDLHLHGPRFSMYAGFDAKEEMSPLIANQAALQHASHAWREDEGHTSLAIHPGLPRNDCCSVSYDLANYASISCIPLATTFQNPLTASPCHLGVGDLPCRSVDCNCPSGTAHSCG